MFFINWKRIIYRMLELAKRWGPYFLGASVGWTGLGFGCLIQHWQILASILFVLASICLIITIIAFIYDIKDARQKDYKKKHPPKLMMG